ncbi:hypothetical protein [Streptomyces thermoalcalitolerans]|uniref:Uncharacterized protein n=1 Tax=Streptomyces thermoalcalitolerans TaxID=65605 RepID=A0ABN1NFU0_9ACTN
MSEPIPPLLPCAALFLASVAILLSLIRTVLPAPSKPPAGRHRRSGPVRTYRSQARPRLCFPCPETPLAGEATRSVRPYVIAAEQAALRREAEWAARGPEVPGPYVVHGMGAA